MHFNVLSDKDNYDFFHTFSINLSTLISYVYIYNIYRFYSYKFSFFSFLYNVNIEYTIGKFHSYVTRMVSSFRLGDKVIRISIAIITTTMHQPAHSFHSWWSWVMKRNSVWRWITKIMSLLRSVVRYSLH